MVALTVLGIGLALIGIGVTATDLPDEIRFGLVGIGLLVCASSFGVWLVSRKPDTRRSAIADELADALGFGKTMHDEPWSAWSFSTVHADQIRAAWHGTTKRFIAATLGSGEASVFDGPVSAPSSAALTQIFSERLQDLITRLPHLSVEASADEIAEAAATRRAEFDKAREKQHR